MRRASLVSYALLALVLLFSACDGSDDGSAQISGGFGELEVHLTDAPLDLATVSSVMVTIDAVTVYGGMELDGTEVPPIELLTHPDTFDLLTLTGGATMLLADGELPAGFYQRIRMGISAASLTFLDGTMVDLKIESNKVDVPIQFEVSAGDLMELVLDFQADASVHVTETGDDRYILRPVVTPVSLPGDDPGDEPDPSFPAGS